MVGLLDDYDQVPPNQRQRSILFGPDYLRALHCECLAYDEGCRVALVAHLQALLALAEKQSRRSGQTVAHGLADRFDRAALAWDTQVVASLRALLAARRGGG
jgi:hypothetical protein